MAAVNGVSEIDINVSKMISENAEDNLKDKEKLNIIKTLFSKEYLRSTLSIAYIFFSMSFGSFGFLLFMPKFLSEFSTPVEYTVIACQQAAGAIGILLASYLVDTKLGRKFTLCFSQCLSSLAIFIFLFVQEFVLVIFI